MELVKTPTLFYPHVKCDSIIWNSHTVAMCVLVKSHLHSIIRSVKKKKKKISIYLMPVTQHGTGNKQ